MQPLPVQEPQRLCACAQLHPSLSQLPAFSLLVVTSGCGGVPQRQTLQRPRQLLHHSTTNHALSSRATRSSDFSCHTQVFSSDRGGVGSIRSPSRREYQYRSRLTPWSFTNNTTV
ncbi:hypothetical protein AX14_011888 [Amanita brunnescens Koide BX004]|nr:hypothetical protein AX14_011888 [Amanita brunnescens Koide BX004]